jgi:hypothetical protein
MAKAKSKLQKAREIASKVKKPNRKKSSVERYTKQGQNAPQSKAWTEPNDEGVSAKPIGWRFTTLGASRLKISNPKTKPSKEQIEKYRGKTFTKGGEQHRYIYQESRVDKSDKSVKAKFKSGGVTFSGRQYDPYNKAMDGNRTAKPVGYRFTDKLAERLGKRLYAKPTKAEVEKYSGRGVYSESRQDKSDLKPTTSTTYASFKKGGVTFSGRQYDPYNKAMDGEKTAKPVGYRFTDKLAKRLGKSVYAKPTKAEVEKYSGRGVYSESRQDKSDLKPTTSKTYASFEDGGMMAKGGKVVKLTPKEKSMIKQYAEKIYELEDEVSELENECGEFADAKEQLDRYYQLDSTLYKKLKAKYGDNWSFRSAYSDATDFADGGMMKKGGATFSGRQYNPYNKAMDGEKTAKPVGYRFTDRLAKRLGKSTFSKPTKAEVEKYLGRGVYWEGRQDKSDLKPTTSKTYASFEDGGMMAKGGTISHYKVNDEIFIDYNDAMNYCDKHNLPYSSIKKTKKYMDGGMMARGGVERISNQEAREYTENMIPFKANNLEGKLLDNGDYVVLSYGYYPIWWYCKSEGKWYGNSTKYSVTTSKQMSQSRPTYDATMLNKDDLDRAMMKQNTKFELGGALNLLADTSGAGLQNVGGTTFSTVDLTSHLDMNANPNF